MASVKSYFLCILSVSILCGVILSFFDKKSAAAGQMKLLTGIILTITVIRPIIDVRLQNIAYYTDDICKQADIAADYGEVVARQEMESIIKTRLQAYILDKATAWNTELEVEVFVQECMPVGVLLSGAVSPYVKVQLENWIAGTLDIPKEAQQWIVS